VWFGHCWYLFTGAALCLKSGGRYSFCHGPHQHRSQACPDVSLSPHHACVTVQVVGDKLLAARDAPAGAAEKALADASTRQASAGDSLSNTAAVTTTTAADGTEQLPSPEDVEGVDGLHSLTAPLLSAEHKRQEGSGATVKLPPTHCKSCGCAKIAGNGNISDTQHSFAFKSGVCAA
jgi:hypothetical protein